MKDFLDEKQKKNFSFFWNFLLMLIFENTSNANLLDVFL
jgi:hypothetical protein